jgi:CheY-like chemotaxis protein
VLVVEDESDAQELLRKILAGAGAEIEVAGSVEQALTLLERGLPDVLLSDIAFTGEDGYTLIRSVRKRQGKRYLPAAAVTAFAGEAERRRAHEAGFDAYVVKPIDEGIVITVQALRGIARATKN